MATQDTIKTRILIISDTHGSKPKEQHGPTDPDTEDELSQSDITHAVTGFRLPLPQADVVLHCGDLSACSRPVEYETTFSMLRQIRAPLKLVIAGNHDTALDDSLGDDPATRAAVSQMICDAEADGVRYLNEGVHSFVLENGASLRVYTSQWTPYYGGWAFQYTANESHQFDIPPGVDVAMTHGPPRGVLDRSVAGTAAGCDVLFQSIHRARPKIHCFGHIHEGWGGYLAKWKDSPPQLNGEGQAGTIHPEGGGGGGPRPSFATAIDQPASRVVKNLQVGLPELKEDSKRRGVLVDLTEGDNRVEQGQHTFFINAAILDVHNKPVQSPWIVDVDLPSA